MADSIPTFALWEEYARRMSVPEPAVLRDLRLYALRNLPCPQMLAGHLQGRFLMLLSRLSRVRRVLEIGTFVGYSALCFAEALPPDGEVITIDNDPTVRPIAERYFRRVPYGRKIRLLIGEALALLPFIPGWFDLVYLDADKRNYIRYYEMVLPKVRSGGLVVADNLFWSGRVLDRRVRDADTCALRAFARRVRNDRRVEGVLLTLRDGLMIIRKK